MKAARKIPASATRTSSRQNAQRRSQSTAQYRSAINAAAGRPSIRTTWEWSASGRKIALRVGFHVGGRYGADPGALVAGRLRSALRRPRTPDCLVSDANGVLIARIDGETRERVAVPRVGTEGNDDPRT